MKKGYKVKIYPNKQQQQWLLQQMGCCRYVYNYFLNLKKETYLKTGEILTYCKMSKQLTILRKNTEWLKCVQYDPLQQSLRNLDVAFNRFYRGKTKFPLFHKKNSKNVFRKAKGWKIKGKNINIARNFKVKYRGKFPEKRQVSLTITRDLCGDWWASTISEVEQKEYNLKGGIGIDLGIESLVTTNEGKKYKNIKVLKNKQEKLKKLSQEFSRTKKDSKRHEKKRLEIARLYRKVANIRKNHLHHISKDIVSKNHALIAMEGLNIIQMMKTKNLVKFILDASWGELLRQIQYKQEWRGGKIFKIDRFFPSSKTCSNCNFIVSSLPLNIRKWACPKCGKTHDRDINAAIMILKQAEERLGVEGKENIGELRFSENVACPVNR